MIDVEKKLYRDRQRLTIYLKVTLLMCQASIEMMFPVPANATLTDAQYASYMAGKLHVNVHSAAYPG
jgi:hypothetical protein